MDLLPYALKTFCHYLSSNQIILATAESCTGGLIASQLTSLAGSSAWFDRGFVTYSNASKQQMLGVNNALIERYGAVSTQVALAMAKGALHASAASAALAVTGIAGPTGGSIEKPIGTVCFAYVTGDNLSLVESQFFLSNNRTVIRNQATLHALQTMFSWLAAG